MTAFLILSALQLIPSFLFDTGSHIGALWGFLVPVFFFICPDQNPDQPIAIMICDTIFAQLSLAMSSVIPVYVSRELLLFCMCRFSTRLIGGLGGQQSKHGLVSGCNHHWSVVSLRIHSGRIGDRTLIIC